MAKYRITLENGEKYVVEADSGEALKRAVSSLNGQGLSLSRPERYTPDAYSSAKIRAKVGNARTQQDKLSTLRGLYPDATAHGDNFRYTDEQGQKIQFNKPGFQAADLAEYGRVPAEIMGGIAAAAPTITAAPVTGMTSLLTTAAAYGLGAEAAGLAYDMAMGSNDSRGFFDRFKSSLASIAANATGGPVNKTKSAGELARQSLAARSGDSAKRLGIELPLSQSTGSKRVADIENSLESTPFGGAVINKKTQGVADALEQQYRNLSSRAPGSPQAQGGRILDSAKGAHRAATAEEKLLWGALEDTFSAQGNSALSRVEVPETIKRLNRLGVSKTQFSPYQSLATNKPLERLKRTFSPALDSADEFGETIPGVPPPYEAIKRARTNFGEEIDNAFLQKPGGTQQGLRDVYGTLTKDLDAAAGQLGGDAGTAAREAANTHTRVMRQQFEELERILGIPKSAAGMSMEARAVDVYKKAKDAFMNNPSKMRSIFKVMSKKRKKEFLDQMVADMGRATKSTQDETGKRFSPATFSTNWAALKEKAPENISLFSKTQRRKLEDMALIASGMKKVGYGVNRSNSGRVLSGPIQSGMGAVTGGILGGWPGAAAGYVGANLPQYLLARAISSPSARGAYELAASNGLLNFDDVVSSAGRKVAGGLFGQTGQ